MSYWGCVVNIQSYHAKKRNWYLWLYKKMHKAPTQRIENSLTWKLSLQQLLITDVSSGITVSHPLCPSKSAKLSTKLADLPKSVSEPRFVPLTLLGQCPGREPRRTIPPWGEGVPPLWKSVCWPQQLCLHLSFPHPQKKPSPSPTAVLTVLRIRANNHHPQLFPEVLSLPFPPPLYPTTRWYLHSTLRKKLYLLQCREVWNLP